MQPHILIKRLETYNVPARLRLLILNFLTNRRQRVRTDKETSDTIDVNTGAPQGCVLSAYLFTLYTNEMRLSSNDADTCRLIKYADDTVITGLIQNNDESHYRKVITWATEWCRKNHLDLNVSKTKEMIIDFRRYKNEKEAIRIQDSVVAQTDSYKYLI